MKLKDTHIILIAVGLFSFFFIAIPYWISSENGNHSVSIDELSQLDGSVKTLRKTTTTGGRYGSSKPIIYLTLSEYPYTFRIANSSYSAIKAKEVMDNLAVGTKVKLWTKKKELARSNSNGILNRVLNSMLKWRKQPLIYSIKTDKLSLLTIQQYNNHEEKFNTNNLKWGIILVLFIAGRLIWVVFKERKEKRATTIAKKS